METNEQKTPVQPGSCETIAELLRAYLQVPGHTVCVEDGFLQEGRNASRDRGCRVLFVLKEAHLGDGSHRGLEPFWFAEAVRAQEGGVRRSKGQQRSLEMRYVFFLSKIAALLGAQLSRDCAYINLNKQGGGAKADAGRLAARVREDAQFLVRQLQLLNPEHIVCCGVSGLRTYRALLSLPVEVVAERVYSVKRGRWGQTLHCGALFLPGQREEAPIRVWETVHPSRYWKSDIERFDEIVQTENTEQGA